MRPENANRREHFGLPRMPKGEVELKQRSTPSAWAAFCSNMLDGLRLGGTLAFHVRSRYVAHARARSRTQQHKEVRLTRRVCLIFLMRRDADPMELFEEALSVETRELILLEMTT